MITVQNNSHGHHSIVEIFWKISTLSPNTGKLYFTSNQQSIQLEDTEVADVLLTDFMCVRTCICTCLLPIGSNRILSVLIGSHNMPDRHNRSCEDVVTVFVIKLAFDSYVEDRTFQNVAFCEL